MNEALRAFVRWRAGDRCEYCGLLQADSPVHRHQIEHILPRKHGGTSHGSNLCLACIDCNLFKGADLTGLDPDTGVLTELFHPRRQKWEDHFAWEKIFVVGKTAVGRTTVWVLNMNSQDQLELRGAM